MVRFFPLGLLVFIFLSCLSEPDCVITATNEVEVSLTHLKSDTSILFDSIMVSGTLMPFYKGDSVSKLVLPVDPVQLTSTFRFYYNGSMDSIRLSYESKPKLISPACGAFTYFNGLSVLSSSFDDVIVSNTELSTSVSPNITLSF